MLVLDMLFVVSAVLFDMLKARQLACVSKSGQKCPAALRSPHGERGLKSDKRKGVNRFMVALLMESVD